ncbi:MAG: phage tail tape measure protein, partial [Pseudomonadota bacterium]
DKGLSGAESKVSSFAGKIGKAAKVAGGAAGAAGGAALAVGFATNLSTESAAAKLSAQLGSTGSLSKAAGEAAGKLYADGYGENLGAVNDAVRAVVQSGALMGDESSAAIEKISKGAINLAAIMGTDVQGSMNAVAQMVKTGLAPNAEVAMDILEKGFQVGNDKAGDLLDTFNEYGTQFRKLGLDGQTAMGIIQQGLKAGARDADVVADAIKEFAIRAVDGSKLTGEGFQAIGLSADDMASKIAAGGPTAAAALDLTLDRLRAMKDPVAQSAAAVALFGTQAEDLGKALIAIDPSSAVAGLGQFQGTMKQVDAATTTTETKITVIQRAVEGWTASLASSKGPLG